MERVLVTGGAGYLGSVLTKRLLERGDRVTCIDNLMYGQNAPILFCGDPNYEFVFGDARDEELIRREVAKADTIIPLAALVGVSSCDRRPIDAETINRDAVININRLRSKDQKLIFPNTNSGYGARTGQIECDETTPLEPISRYGQTKCAAERELLEGDKNSVVLRLATVFGLSPRMRTDLLVNDFVLQAMNGGVIALYEEDFKRNFIHIQDTGRAFLHADEKFGEMYGRAFNVGLDDTNLTKRELAERIKGHLPGLVISSEARGSDPDKRNYIVSNKRIVETGFKPAYSLDDGIRELINGYSILMKINPMRN